MQNTPTFNLRPLQKPMFQLSTENSHPRLSLTRVLHVKFLRWVEQSTLKSLLTAFAKCSMLLLFLAFVIAPSFTIGALTASAKWNHWRLPIFSCILILTLNAPRLYRLTVRWYGKRKTSSNQHTYHGLPLDELLSYLFTKRTFSMEAMQSLGLTQTKWRKIAEELEHNGILTRGESNTRVLAEISREELTRQLRDGFPLVFDPVGKQWVERRGTFDRWVLERDRKQQREGEKQERLERKEERLRKSVKRLQEESSAFQTVLGLAGAHSG